MPIIRGRMKIVSQNARQQAGEGTLSITADTANATIADILRPFLRDSFQAC